MPDDPLPLNDPASPGLNPVHSGPWLYCDRLPDVEYTESNSFIGTIIELTDDEAAHASRVLRVVPGDRLTVFNGRGTVAPAVVADSNKRRVACEVLAAHGVPRPRPSIVLATALPKGSRADDYLDAVTQAGVTTIIPLTTERSVVQPRETKLDRLRTRMIVACKQSRRAWVPELNQTATLDDLVASDALRGDDHLALLLDPKGKPHHPSLRSLHAGRITLLVGPEGGFTNEEQARCTAVGVQPWWIGPHVMRIETAGIVAVALARYLASDTTA